ncbi:hypothetical protein [Campylobacter mucosalis]|uniref:hypothetical protein n=1 Tax=Campylobacter mucosalis TaxID=202 RepID=UPI00147043C3|nr:hypothetical protein [Campylobacter mucosalis]
MRQKICVGILAKTNKPREGINLATLAAIHELGSVKNGIAQRSFLKEPLLNQKNQITNAINANLAKFLKGKISEDVFLGRVGEVAVDIAQSAIEDGKISLALSPKTIKRKGSSRPLIDTGLLKNSIAWELV